MQYLGMIPQMRQRKCTFHILLGTKFVDQCQSTDNKLGVIKFWTKGRVGMQLLS